VLPGRLREAGGVVSYLRKDEELWQALAEVAADEGLELYDAERVGETVLRVSIVKSGAGPGAQGATSGDCTKLCKRLMVYLHVEAARLGLREEIQLEVSSPGVNRELRLPSHFMAAMGQRVKVVTHPLADTGGHEVHAPRTVIGLLQSFEQETLGVLDEQTGENVVMPLAGIKKARIDFKF